MRTNNSDYWQSGKGIYTWGKDKMSSHSFQLLYFLIQIEEKKHMDNVIGS